MGVRTIKIFTVLNSHCYVPFGIPASPGFSTCLAATSPVNQCSWESATATVWALAATATSREEEGNYEHGFLLILSTSVSGCSAESMMLLCKW